MTRTPNPNPEMPTVPGGRLVGAAGLAVAATFGACMLTSSAVAAGVVGFAVALATPFAFTAAVVEAGGVLSGAVASIRATAIAFPRVRSVTGRSAGDPRPTSA